MMSVNYGIGRNDSGSRMFFQRRNIVYSCTYGSKVMSSYDVVCYYLLDRRNIYTPLCVIVLLSFLPLTCHFTG